ncbi:hypothetical protein PG996_011703 [Apiospora saccharicola]|uniref:Uncharacterized protein n=1 Tax=Apiospora saccharicola TaxID=335842 RepID=A0ABR1UFT3_9PEZI
MSSKTIIARSGRGAGPGPGFGGADPEDCRWNNQISQLTRAAARSASNPVLFFRRSVVGGGAESQRGSRGVPLDPFANGSGHGFFVGMASFLLLVEREGTPGICGLDFFAGRASFLLLGEFCLPLSAQDHRPSWGMRA